MRPELVNILIVTFRTDSLFNGLQMRAALIGPHGEKMAMFWNGIWRHIGKETH